MKSDSNIMKMENKLKKLLKNNNIEYINDELNKIVDNSTDEELEAIEEPLDKVENYLLDLIFKELSTSMLNDIITFIEKEENDKIENIIKVIYQRFSNSVGFLDDDYKKMLGVFYYSFIAYGLENKLLPNSYTLPKNLISHNPNIQDMGLNTNDNYEMLLLGLYFYFESFKEFQTDEIIVKENNLVIIDDKEYIYYEIA